MLALINRALWTDRYGAPALIRRLLVEHASAHWLSYVVSFALMGIAAGCTSYMAYLVGHAVNEAYLAHDFAAIVAVSLLAIAIFTVRGLASYGQAVLLAQIGNEMTAANQQRMFDKLLRERFSYFADRPSAFFMSQVSYGASAVPAALGLLLTTMGRDGLALIGLAAVMVIQDPMLSLVGLVVMPPAVLFVRNLLRRIRSTAVNQFEGGAGLLETMQETLQGMRIVKSFGLEGEMRRRVKASAELARRAGNEFARLSNRSGPMMEALGGCAIALVFLYGGYRVNASGASPGQFVSFITAFLLAYEPAKRLARLHIDLHAVLPGVRMLFELLDSPETEPDEEDKPGLRVAGGRIELIDVEFAYRPGEPVLRQLAFTAEAGCVTALVGRSGGGKSTAFNLLLRFYQPDKGTISIDGQDIAAVSRRSLRQQIAYVGQDVFLFRAAIRDNIRYGRIDAGEDEIVAAAKAANAHDFITAFPSGYATPVGEHGLALSAGERQRVSIARALLKNAPILLLDEATAALDSESEREVQDALARLCAGRTTLVIAHRLSTVADADAIHVVEDGSVVESGRHAELLHRDGRYAAFYRLLLRDMPVAPKLDNTVPVVKAVSLPG
ncbi:MAG TPA: ABC transporter ATP-binding protein [Xanthobacteraceae bacterium]|jgi:ATP-binding cassette subfamily B protein